MKNPKKGQMMAIREVVCDEIKYDISYNLLNSSSKKKSIIFLHGWGSNKTIMQNAFGSYFKEYQHIYIDLPGFGGSSIEKPINSYEYKKIIDKFLCELKFEPSIIVGHSFGGKIATLLQPKKLVLLSSAGIVPKKPLNIRIKIKVFKFLKLLGLGGFYRFFATKDVENMSKTMYETLKKVVDEDMNEEFARYEGKAYIFWGEEDRATPLKSGEIIASLIKNSEFFPLRGDHFFFLQHAKFIDGVLGDES